jgi:hypothetical protein
MTQREAKELMLKPWTYLAEHPECYSKEQVPPELYSKIKNLENRCPLCETFWRLDCDGCPLKEAGEDCNNDSSAFYLWFKSMIYENDTRRKAALRIVEIVSAWEPED